MKDNQIEELARSFCGLSAKLKCSECSYECFQKEYARKAIEAGYLKASDVASEIFAEIEAVIRRHDERPKYKLMLDLAELQKKYIGKDTNVTTNTEDGE
jgi:hypothetical protein